MEIILIVGGGIAVLLLVMGIVITARSERTLVEERLGQYIDDDAELERRRGTDRATPVGDWHERRLERVGLEERIARHLARADLKLKPGEYIALLIISAVGGAFIVGYINEPSDPLNLFTIVGGIVGFLIPQFWVSRLQRRRLVRFSDQLADMLNLMVNGLRAGYSTMQSLEAVSREMPSPISEEFRRVVQEMQLGIPMEEALENLLRRIQSDDLDLVVTAMNVQREVGGNLAEILDTISYTIRERVRIKGEIRVLISQVMYSGRFLALMPIIIGLVLWFLNREYMMEFFNPDIQIPGCIISTPGIIALIIGGIMELTGYIVMTRIADIDV